MALLSAVSPRALGRERGTPRDPATITTIVVHTVGGPACIDKRILFKPIPVRANDAAIWKQLLRAARVADAHFVIGRNGTVEQVLPVAEVANHTVGANAVSVGIELVHRGDGLEPFEAAQIAALNALIKKLRHELPAVAFNNIVGHDELDERTCVCGGVTYHRRQDPGANFPWDQVLAAVRLPADPARGKTSLTPLVGPAPTAACPAS